MTTAELLNSVQYLVDETGEKKAVQIDFSVWQQIVTIIQEMEADQRWDELFANSQDALAKLANEALAEHQQGLTEALDPDQL